MPSSDVSQKLTAGFDPRRRIERDPFNELFVFFLSATGASIIAPVLLAVVAIFTGDPGLIAFVVFNVVIELVLIFGIGRPNMKPKERVGWALLWGAAAAFFGFCFHLLVLDPLL